MLSPERRNNSLLSQLRYAPRERGIRSMSLSKADWKSNEQLTVGKGATVQEFMAVGVRPFANCKKLLSTICRPRPRHSRNQEIP